MEALGTALAHYAAGRSGVALLDETAVEVSLHLELRLRLLLRRALRLARRGRGCMLTQRDVADAWEEMERGNLAKLAAGFVYARQSRGQNVVRCLSSELLKAKGQNRTVFMLVSRPSGLVSGAAGDAAVAILRRASEAIEPERFQCSEKAEAPRPKKPQLSQEQKVKVVKLVGDIEAAERTRSALQLAQLDAESMTAVAEFLAQHVPKRIMTAGDEELLVLLEMLESITLGASTGGLQHLHFNVSRRAADVLGRLVRHHQHSWPELGDEVRELLRKALHRRPFWRAVEGVAFALMQLGPQAVREVLLPAFATRWRGPQPTADASSAAGALLAVLEALRMAVGPGGAVSDPRAVMNVVENLSEAFGVHGELWLVALGTLAEATSSEELVRRGQKRRRESVDDEVVDEANESPEPRRTASMAEELRSTGINGVVRCAQANQEAVLHGRQNPARKLAKVLPEMLALL
eukprot:g17577.t1